MPNKLAEYWCKTFEAAHGVKYPFRPRDAAMLKRVLEDCGDKRSLAWEIKEFHERAWKTAWVAEAGYDTRMFVRMHLGLHIEYVKAREVHQAKEKRQQAANLDRAASSAQVIDLAEHLERKFG